MKTKQDRLSEILDTMDVPKFRRKDLKWLNRNIWIKNDEHPDIDECCNLINDLLLKKAFKNADYLTSIGARL